MSAHRRLLLFGGFVLAAVTFTAPHGFTGGPGEEPAFQKNEVTITEREGMRHIVSNGIPDHAPGQFPNRNNPNRISPQRNEYRVTLTPEVELVPTPIGMNPFGVALNGIVFDPSAAEFWQRNPQSGWQYDAMVGGINLGLDDSHAHVQPDGSYHYHGLPTQLIERLTKPDSMTLIGYAGDGFPIYAMHGYDNADDPSSRIRKLTSSWQIRKGRRPDGPGDFFDGTFVEDWEYVKDSGDLDDCNGRIGVTPESPGGTYYYVLTDTFPYIPRRWAGQPDDSFQRRRMPGGGPGGRGAGPRGGGPPGIRPPQ